MPALSFRTSLVALALVTTGALAGCRGTDASAAPTVAADSSATPADSAQAGDLDPSTIDASRIVILGGPITETVYALGLGDNVVGTDRSSLYPAEVHTKPQLSYFRQTSAEGVLSLNPTLVLAVDGSGPPGVLEQIRATGVPLVMLPEPTDVAGAEARIRRIGRLLGRADSAEAVVATMRRELAAAEAAQPAQAPRALFIYARGAAVVMASGTGNAADAVLRLAGAENAITAFDDYRPLTAEAVAGAAPDVIVIPSHGLESIGGIDGLLRQPGLAQTPAGRNRRVVAVDDALLLGFGPRVGEGVQALVDGFNEGSSPS